MKKMKCLFAAVLLLAGMAMPDGTFFNQGAGYISNDVAEVNRTFQTASRPCRLWGATQYVLIRFDYTEFQAMPSTALCTLYVTKTSFGGWPDAAKTWDLSDAALYVVKGTWTEGSLDADADNSTGLMSWNYRAYPTTWSGTTTGNTAFTSAQKAPNSKYVFGGSSLNDPMVVPIDKKQIDSMKTGRYGGFALVGTGASTQYYVAHTGHFIDWVDGPAIEKEGAAAVRFTLSASPNPATAATTLSAGLRLSDKNASLAVYNMNGQKVADLSSQLKTGASVRILWSTAALPNGVYLAKLVAGKNQIVKRITLIK